MPLHVLGLEIEPAQITATLLTRRGEVVAEHSEPVRGETNEAGALLLDTSYLRASCSRALKGLFLSVTIDRSHIWGLGLAGPDGFVPLDHDLKPLAPVHIPAPERAAADFSAWIEEHHKELRRVAVFLPPKDFLRFLWSGSLATDVTNAEGLGLLSPQSREWDVERAPVAVEPRWLPPVFESYHRIGRFTPEGASETGVPASAWVTAGARNRAAALLAAGDLRREGIYLEAGKSPIVAWIQGPDSIPPRRHAIPETRYRELPLEAFEGTGPGTAIVDFRAGQDPAEVERWAREHGYTARLSPYAGGASAGAGLLALLGSGSCPSIDALYRRLPRAEEDDGGLDGPAESAEHS